jgi:hypothetical protein
MVELITTLRGKGDTATAPVLESCIVSPSSVVLTRSTCAHPPGLSVVAQRRWRGREQEKYGERERPTRGRDER